MEDSPQPLDGNLGAHVLHVEQEGVEGRPQVPAVPHSEGRTSCSSSPQLGPVCDQRVDTEHGAVDVVREGLPSHGLADPLELQLRLKSGY